MQCERLQVPSLAYPGGYAESMTVARDGVGPHPRRVVVRRSCSDGVCGGDDLQRPAADQGRRGRSRRGARRRRPWPPRCAIRPCHGLRDRRHRAGCRQSRRRTRTRCPSLHRLDGRPTSRRTDRSWAARPSCSRPAANSAAIGQTVGGLGPQGELVIVGVTPDPLPISPIDLITAGRSVSGHPSGTARDVEETMHFAVQAGVRAADRGASRWTEAAEAYAAMEDGRARYRMVIDHVRRRRS